MFWLCTPARPHPSIPLRYLVQQNARLVIGIDPDSTATARCLALPMRETRVTAPTHLRVEHSDEPLGITVRNPRMSWRLPAHSERQLAYRIRAGRWDSGRVESTQSRLIPYAGPPLSSGERVTWSVRVWTEAGPSPWADAAWWEMGLLDPRDWTAVWIEPGESVRVRSATPRPAYQLRGALTVDRPVARARLHATAHGIYECFVNGRRVGDLELTPGFTSYDSILQVQTYDVTDLLAPGENAIGAIVSDGWFRGQNSGLRLTDVYGPRVALLVQLDLYDDEGRLTRVGTGPEWTWRIGAIHGADLMQGQLVDLRSDTAGWCAAGSSTTGSGAVATGNHDLARLRQSPAPPVRRIEEIRPLHVHQPLPGRQVVDLGQNITGRLRLSRLGPNGTSLRLTHGEALDDLGCVTTTNITTDIDAHPTFGEPEHVNLTLPLQEDHVISSGVPNECFEPRHTTHGFRYVCVEGHPDPLQPSDIAGVVVHTDLRRTGWFSCSDERINRLHEAAVWSFRDNACDIPTDCPTRERAGWTGDWQIFLPAAAFLYDVAGFSVKWLDDLAAEQRDDGMVFDCVPKVIPAELSEKLGFGNGSAGWGDAAVVVPWEIYRAYGDAELLARQWRSMTAWVDFAARAAREARHPNRMNAQARPAPHEEFLWDTGFHWGEWMEPGVFDVAAHIADLPFIDHSEVATAHLSRSARLLASIAELLGRDHDADRYRQLADETRAAWAIEFIRPDGSLTRETQAAYVRALAFDLAPAGLRGHLAQRLVALVREAETHLGTGFLATPHLLPALADAGHQDVAYELLFQDTEPSWLTMIDRGATTIWERWDGIDADGGVHASLNHYSKGAVVSFLHGYVAGIRLLDEGPAYRRFQVAPVPGGGLTWARAVHDSPYGRIAVSWHIDPGTFALEICVPPGTSAGVIMPDGRLLDARPGTWRFACPWPATPGR